MASRNAKPKDPQPAPITNNDNSDIMGLVTPILEDIKANITCSICFGLLYEPFVSACGHTTCYSCLCRWFEQANRQCPVCRARINHAPAPNYAVRNMVGRFIQHTQLTGDDNSYEEHLTLQNQEKLLIEADRNNKDESNGGLFKGRFKLPPLQVVRDAEDGVDRCPGCNWELEVIDGMCFHCGLSIDNSSDEVDRDSEADEDEDLDEEIDMEDAHDDEADGSSDDAPHMHPGAQFNAVLDTIDLAPSSDPDSPGFETTLYMDNQSESMTDGSDGSEEDEDEDSFVVRDEDAMDEDHPSDDSNEDEDDVRQPNPAEPSDSTPRHPGQQVSNGRNSTRGRSRRVIDSDDDDDDEEDTSRSTRRAAGVEDQRTAENVGEIDPNNDLGANQPPRSIQDLDDLLFHDTDPVVSEEGWIHFAHNDRIYRYLPPHTDDLHGNLFNLEAMYYDNIEKAREYEIFQRGLRLQEKIDRSVVQEGWLGHRADLADAEAPEGRWVVRWETLEEWNAVRKLQNLLARPHYFPNSPFRVTSQGHRFWPRSATPHSYFIDPCLELFPSGTAAGPNTSGGRRPWWSYRNKQTWGDPRWDCLVMEGPKQQEHACFKEFMN